MTEKMTSGLLHRARENGRCVCLVIIASLDVPLSNTLSCVCVSTPQKHKERDRHKPKHKKALELSPSLVSGHLMVNSEKVSSHTTHTSHTFMCMEESSSVCVAFWECDFVLCFGRTCCVT